MQNTYDQKQRYASALREMVIRLEPRFFGTFVYNDDPHVDKVERLSLFFAEFDSGFAGTNWSRKPFEKRLSGVIFFEHVATNVHAHALLTAPDQVDLEMLNTKAPPIWEKYVPAGNLLVEPISDVEGVAWYCTKEWHRCDFDEQVLWTNMLPSVKLQFPQR